jgi:hypothetical protein
LPTGPIRIRLEGTEALARRLVADLNSRKSVSARRDPAYMTWGPREPHTYIEHEIIEIFGPTRLVEEIARQHHDPPRLFVEILR